MNPFSPNHKNPETRLPQRFKIKSKYFGQYEPQVFIASKSKSKSKSTSKDDINYFITKKSPLNSQPIKIVSQQLATYAQTITINPQTNKSPRPFNSGSLSEYLLTRSTSPGRKKQGSAIEKIVEWVERKYFEKMKNHKIEKDKSLSFLRDQKYTYQSNEKQKFQQSFKKFAYDAFILSRLQGPRSPKPMPLQKTKKSFILYNQGKKYESKENDIDNINISPVKQVSKAEDFDIYKFKKNPNYSSDVNLMRISQLSIENIHRSGQKAASNQHLPDKEQFSSKKHTFEIPTMNTLQNLDIKENARAQSQKSLQVNQIDYRHKTFFVETARSTSTNEMMDLSKNSISQNSLTQKQKHINRKETPNTELLLEADFKTSQNIKEDSEKIQLKDYQSFVQKTNPELKTANRLELIANKKLSNQAGLCEIDNWPNSLFHPEKLPQNVIPTQVDEFSLIEQKSEQILGEIFQMNDDQQHILKTIGSKHNSLLYSQNKNQKTQTLEKPDSIINKINPNNDSQVSRSRKSLAQNYFTMHLGINQQPNQVKTYEMPLAKANTNFKVKTAQENSSHARIVNTIIAQNKSPSKEVFTFNSLNSQDHIESQKTIQKASFQQNKQQTNAFVQKCNLFAICTGDNRRQLQRSNYFTEMQTSGRQRVTSAHSNHSKVSSKPKVNFNYISPSSKNMHVLAKEKQSESSILFKSQTSQLKNIGRAPVKIDIKPSREKPNDEISQSIVKEVIPSQVRQFRSQSIVVEKKERSQSVPHVIVQRAIVPKQKIKMEPITEYTKVNNQQTTETKNGFVSAGYGSSCYYQSQKVIPSALHNQASTIQSNYLSAQSYYFPGMVSPNMGNAQIIANKGLGLGPTSLLKKDKQPVTTPQRSDQRYLYPIQKSVEKQRDQRARSLCEKIIVTVKKSQC